jgi:hypothetical protein
MLRQKRLLAVGVIAAAVMAVWGSMTLPTMEARGAADDWTPLFNGKDLSGWDTWLGKPHKSVEGLDLKKDAKGEYVGSVGLNKDPEHVYTVVDLEGKPAIRISGEVFGALTSKEEYGNYHLRLEFRWGEKKWAPRDKAARDSGLLYHCYGEHGAASTFWMRSLECQIMEQDCGSYYNVGSGIVVDVEGERQGEKGRITYKKGGMKFADVKQSILRSADYEKPTGEWNTIDLLAVGDQSVHLVNGKPNMALTHIRKAGGTGETLTRGKIQIQSEGAEVFYRNIAIKPLSKIPDEYLR